MMDEAALLHRYAENHDEAAFGELVRRHLDGVYSIALRRVGGDAHLAEDVAQQVFLGLARDAKRLSAHPVLAGWLHTTTRNASANVVRTERRRKTHEQEAHAMHDALSKGPAEADWNQLAPVIEEAVDQLGESDRVAVLLRCIEQRTFGEIGAVLRLSEDAARKRVDRALEKLRVILGRSGVNSSAAALAGALTTHAVTAAPPGLATTVTGTAIAGALAPGSALSFLAFMSMTKVQLSIRGAMLLLGGLGGAWWHKTHSHYAREVATTRAAGPAQRHSPNEMAQLAPALAESVGVPPATVPPQSVIAATAPKEPTPSDVLVASQWSNRGRNTPRDAVETFFWAVRAFDQIELAKTITFTPADRQKAEALFARLSPEARSKLQIASAEEMFAWAWSFKRQVQVDRFRVLTTTVQGPDEATLQLAIARADLQRINKGEMQMHRAADGWQWVVPSSDNDQIFRFIKTKLLEELLGQKS